MKPKILFIGGTPRGFEVLKLLVEQKEDVVSAFILKEDENEKVKISHEMVAFCQEHQIPAVVCKRIKVDQIARILKLQADVAFVCGWRTIIPPALFKEAKFGYMAAHDSLLPKYRGCAPVNWAIINGEKTTGVTLFKIEDGPIDSGPIYGQRIVEIGSKETAFEVYQKIIEATVVLYRDYLKELKSDSLKGIDQNDKEATYTCKRIPDDGEVDWSKSSKDIFNLIRALAPPYPCAWTTLNDKKIYITKVSLPENALSYVGNIPGRIVSVKPEHVAVLCGEGQLLIERIIDSSGEEMNASQYLTSHMMTLGR